MTSDLHAIDATDQRRPGVGRLRGPEHPLAVVTGLVVLVAILSPLWGALWALAVVARLAFLLGRGRGSRRWLLTCLCVALAAALAASTMVLLSFSLTHTVEPGEPVEVVD